MSIFTFRKPSFLGIDFGMSHVKAVELTLKNDRPYLLNYGEVLVDFSDIKDSAIDAQTPEEKIQSLLLALLQGMRPQSNNAYVAMPGFSGLITLIELPKMNPSELETAIKFEAQRYIPSPLSEVVLSWDIVAPSSSSKSASGASESLEILLVAALHKEVEKYQRYVAATPLKMEMLELETFSLTRALAFENDKILLIVDIGSRSTNLILVDNGSIKINRNLNAGGHEVTTTIFEALNVSWERANAIKSGDKDFLNNKESVIMFPSLELIVNESRRMLAAYTEKHTGAQIDHVILSGGTSKMTGLVEYFSRALNMPIEIGNPWQRIAYDKKFEQVVSKLDASYSVAVGLALAGVEAHRGH